MPARVGTQGNSQQQDLPVAAHPAVQAPRVGEDARRVVVDDLDVGDEGRARVEALEEVVGEERVLGDAFGEGGAKASTSSRPLPVKIPSPKRS